MSSIDKLSEIFKKFPGIGQRQAKRFVYFLLTRDQKFLKELSDNLLSLRKGVKICKSCFRFYGENSNPNALCRICADADREASLLMVVERDADLENVERSGVYKGLYFVLGGSIPTLDKNPYKQVRVKELIDVAGDRLKNGYLKEIIIATNANPDGDNTASFIITELQKLKGGLKVSILGRGLSTGTELEYSDADTLRNALKHRE